MNSLCRHPLLNPKATHYDTGEKPAIFEFERETSVEAMVGWCEVNILKYKHRRNHKGQRDSDDEKIETYKAYRNALIPLLHKGYKYQTVSHALELEGIEYAY